MENATKALIMAAEILVGVMIISIAVYLFKTFADYSADNYQKIEDTQIAEFNDKFTRFYGNKDKDGKMVPIECTIHDIVGLANLAQKYNLENELIQSKKRGYDIYEIISGITMENSLYVQVDLGSIKNLELKSNEYLVKLIKENDLVKDASGKKSDVKYYKCITCEARGGKKRINYVKFVVI